MWQILNGVWPEVANMSWVRRYRPRNAPSPVSLPDLHDCYKDGEESDYSRHHGNQPEARTDRIWTTMDRVVLWDNHSWNWAEYLLISDRIRVNASSLFFICVLKIPLLKVLKCLHLFFFFLFPVSFWSLKRVAELLLLIWFMSPQPWQSGFYFGNSSTLQLPCFYSEKQNIWGSLIYKFSPSGFFCAVHPSSWLHPRFHQWRERSRRFNRKVV